MNLSIHNIFKFPATLVLFQSNIFLFLNEKEETKEQEDDLVT